MTNTTGSCGPVIKAKGNACILPIKAFTVGEALTSGQWRCYNGGMYVVCKDFDGKLNYPDSKYFKGPYGLEDVLNGAIQPCAGDMLCLCPPIWGACNTDGSVCVPAYDMRACAWDYDPVLKEYRLYTSLKEDNHTKPYEGSIANPKTWDGGYDTCGYLNRPVAKDMNGKLYYPGDKDTVFCGVQCSAVDNPDFTYVGGKLRVNFPAPPTPVRIVAIDDSGTQTTITLSDSTVISGPEIDKDDYVVSYVKTVNAAGESILTITMKSGATHQVTLPASVVMQDSYVTSLIFDSVSGKLTASRNNNLPALEVTIPQKELLYFHGIRKTTAATPITDDPYQIVFDVKADDFDTGVVWNPTLKRVEVPRGGLFSGSVWYNMVDNNNGQTAPEYVWRAKGEYQDGSGNVFSAANGYQWPLNNDHEALQARPFMFKATKPFYIYLDVVGMSGNGLEDVNFILEEKPTRYFFPN